MKTNLNFSQHILAFVVLSGFLWLLSGCKKEEPQPSQPFQELIWVTNKGSQMPVWMTGNKESAFIVLFIHGGPGQSMIAETGIYTLNPAENLSDNFLLAMWDQRYAVVADGMVNDCVVPADVAYPFNAKLGSLGKIFQFKLYPDCWHAPMISNRDQYIKDIKNFIDEL
jgi:hypothetical protein